MVCSAKCMAAYCRMTRWAEEGRGSLRGGMLEGSNVNATEMLVQMIEASRAWETQVKLIDTAKQIDDGGASLMKLPGA